MAQITSIQSRASLAHLSGYRAEVKIRSFPPLHLDEPRNLGGGDSAPSPLEYLLTAVGGCLLSSLTLCLQKKRVEAGLGADVTGQVERDADGFLRVERIDVTMRVTAPETDWKKAQGCFEIFKKYCIVSASVARGIPIETELALSAPGP